MKKIILSAMLTVIGFGVVAQIDADEKKLKTQAKGSTDTTKAWDVGGNFNLNLTQVALSNWAGGGESSMSLQGILGLYANYSKGRSAWDNNLDLAYGMIKTGKANWFKNDDRIELNSKYGYKASKNWYYAALLNFRSQFTEGYGKIGDANYISNFMSPGYLTFALGMDYKPNDKFTMFVSPATLKMTAVLDDSLASVGAFGVDTNQNIRTEFGGYIKASFTEPKVFGNENLSFKTSISLFTNYKVSPQNIDVTWDAALVAKIAKYFTVSLTVNLIYDDDINIQRYNSDGTPRYMTRDDGSEYLDTEGKPIPYTGPITQIKEVLAIGFAYKF